MSCRINAIWLFGISNFGHWGLPFDLAQGGESFDFAQDREPVERLVEPFVIWDLTNFIMGKNVLLDQSEFSKLHMDPALAAFYIAVVRIWA